MQTDLLWLLQATLDAAEIRGNGAVAPAVQEASSDNIVPLLAIEKMMTLLSMTMSFRVFGQNTLLIRKRDGRWKKIARSWLTACHIWFGFRWLGNICFQSHSQARRYESQKQLA